MADSMAETMTGLLSAEDLSLFRGERCLFKQLAFALNAGELLLVEGPNGCGKTSLLRVIAGLLDPESGRIMWNGANVADDRQGFRAELAWMAHKVGFKNDLTLTHNLRFECGLRSTDWPALDAVLQRLNLSNLTRLPLRALSAGQQRRVTMARMLLSDASLWLMDEPFTNLDTAGRTLLTDVVVEHLANDGLAVIASHQPIDLDAPVRRVVLQ